MIRKTLRTVIRLEGIMLVADGSEAMQRTGYWGLGGYEDEGLG